MIPLQSDCHQKQIHICKNYPKLQEKVCILNDEMHFTLANTIITSKQSSARATLNELLLV